MAACGAERGDRTPVRTRWLSGLPSLFLIPSQGALGTAHGRSRAFPHNILAVRHKYAEGSARARTRSHRSHTGEMHLASSPPLVAIASNETQGAERPPVPRCEEAPRIAAVLQPHLSSRARKSRSERSPMTYEQSRLPNRYTPRVVFAIHRGLSKFSGGRMKMT
jgi:hypothetical protein